MFLLLLAGMLDGVTAAGCCQQSKRTGEKSGGITPQNES